MRTNTTYPTSHPHWIDEDGYSKPRRRRIGISFPLAFALVLGLHLAGVAGIYAFSNAKPKKPAVAAVSPAEKPTGPVSDSLARNEWPRPESRPKVVATPPPAAKQTASARPTPQTEQKPMPAVAAKPMEKARPAVIAKATPKPGPAAPVATDSATKKAFLASRANPQPGIENRQARTALPQVQPVAAPRPSQPVATAAPASPAVVQRKPLEPASPRPGEYTLAPGDNLYMVSRRLQVSYNDLMQANGLTDPRQLRVGQKLKVPAQNLASL